MINTDSFIYSLALAIKWFERPNCTAEPMQLSKHKYIVIVYFLTLNTHALWDER